jgi:alkylated DNA repair dioxygenase AlkB
MTDGSGLTPLLFGPDAPPGFRYAEDLITVQDEAHLAREFERVEFSDFTMRGVVARRRVAFFGASYRSGETETLPIPPFLLALRDVVARWAGVESRAFTMALITQYPPGAPIGWHRDAPQYDLVAGVSLLSSCRMRFRRYVSPASASSAQRLPATHEVALAPRSAYVMTGPARYEYEHNIPAVDALRYSVTFRTTR